jgi:2-dehydropantoate 2-reductase
MPWPEQLVSARIGVIGAGAIGCYLGGVLADRGHSVTLVGRERVCAEVRASGLVLTTFEQRSRRLLPRQLLVTTDSRALAEADVVLVATKCAHTLQAGEQLRAVLQSQTVVISTQNGLRNAEVLRAALPAHPVLSAIVGFNVRSLGGGCFRQSTSGPLVIEATAHAAVLEMARTFSDCGLEVELSNNIRALQWAKLIMNLNNAISALSGAPTQQLLFNSHYRKVLRAVMKEALTVLRAARVRPGRFGALPVSLYPAILGLPTLLLRLVLYTQLKVDPDARSSMWEDLTRGRATEVDELSGVIVQLAALHGCEAPLNSRLVAVVHEVEARRAGSPTWSAQRLLQELGMRA